MGAVYRAHDSYLGQDVSIKILRKTNSMEQQAIRFQREAKILCQLTHKNLATVLDFGTTTENNFFMVTKFIDAVTLKEHIKVEPEIPLADILIIAEQLASCLSYVHSKDIFHRDIKSTNILINKENGSIKTFLLDFGIAKPDQQKLLEENLTETGMVIGTPDYLSPEQALGQEVDQRSDIYSFGCVAFELVTGKLPFAGNSNLDVIYKHIEDKPPKISEVSTRKDIPEDLELLISNLLEKDPEKRISSMDSVLSELKQLTPIPSNQENIEQGQFTELKNKFEEKKKPKLKIALLVSSAFVAIFFAVNMISSFSKTDRTIDKQEELFMNNEGFQKTKEAATESIESTAEMMQIKKTKFHVLNYQTSVGRKKLTIVKVIPGDLDSSIDWNNLSGFKKDFLLDTKELSLSKNDLVKILSYPKLKALNFTQFKSDNNQCFSLISDTRNDLIFLVMNSLKDLKPETFSKLGSFSKLGKIEFERCNLTKGKVSALPELKSLETIKIESDPIFDDSAFSTMIKKVPKLANLAIVHCNFRGANLNELSSCKHLTILDFTRTRVSDKSINKLLEANIPLYSIDLTNTHITSKGFIALNKIKSLRQVIISDCEYLNDHEISAFSKTMNFKTKNVSILN